MSTSVRLDSDKDVRKFAPNVLVARDPSVDNGDLALSLNDLEIGIELLLRDFKSCAFWHHILLLLARGLEFSDRVAITVKETTVQLPVPDDATDGIIKAFSEFCLIVLPECVIARIDVDGDLHGFPFVHSFFRTAAQK